MCRVTYCKTLLDRSCVSVQEKYHISVLYNQIDRLKEEESLLLLELTQYLMYFKNTIPEKLECDIRGNLCYNNCIPVHSCSEYTVIIILAA